MRSGGISCYHVVMSNADSTPGPITAAWRQAMRDPTFQQDSTVDRTRLALRPAAAPAWDDDVLNNPAALARFAADDQLMTTPQQRAEQAAEAGRRRAQQAREDRPAARP